MNKGLVKAFFMMRFCNLARTGISDVKGFVRFVLKFVLSPLSPPLPSEVQISQ